MKCALQAFLIFLLTVSALGEDRGTPVTLTLTFDESAADTATGTIPGRVVITNTGDVALTSIGLTLDAIDRVGELSIVSPGFTCSGAGTYLQCTYGPVGPQSAIVAEVRFRFPKRAGRARLRVYVDYSTSGARRVYGDLEETSLTMWRRFVVTSAEDAGSGTLRDVIAAVNAEPVCATEPCSIDFSIPTTGPWVVIHPLTALPTIVAGDLAVDAATQQDTNALGPDVALIGTTLGAGNGLDIRSPRMIVRGLAIGGFPDSGIFYLPWAPYSRFTVESNYIGVDATGRYALPNGSRGITIGGGDINESIIRENVISGNFRSGIFVATQTNGTFPLLRIRGNRIGVAAATDDPIGNGASGIFVGPRATGVLIEDNVIAHNAHFGIAVATDASFTRIDANRIFGHPLSAIDVGLDGPTQPVVLRLASARYDVATNRTTVEVEGPGRIAGDQWYEFNFYVNETVDVAGHSEAEQHLGRALADITTGHATFLFEGDLRGRYINAVPTRVHLYWADAQVFISGELLRAVLVE